MSKNLTSEKLYVDLDRKFSIIKRKIWNMDTSHDSIITKFINSEVYKCEYFIISIDGINKKGNDIFKISFIDENENEILKYKKAINTVGQYLRILYFYNIIDLPSNLKNWTFHVNEILNKKIYLNSFNYKNPISYIEDKILTISNNIREILKTDNNVKLKNDYLRILTNFELFVNYFHYIGKNKLIFEEFEEFVLNTYPKNVYDNTNKLLNKRSIEKFYIEASYSIYLLSFFNILFEVLKIKKEDFENNINISDLVNKFSMYGDLGEKIVYEYLKEKYDIVKHISSTNKYANHDIEYYDEGRQFFVEVKTKTESTKKQAFQMSFNEYLLLKNESDKYYLYYVDNMPNITSLKNIYEKYYTSKDLKLVLKETELTNVNITNRSGKELLDKFNFKEKGFWVSEK